MSLFYTGLGDSGTTGLLGDVRLPKHHLRLETLGSLDEASAALGLARSMISDPNKTDLIREIQRDLYLMMSEVAATPENASRFRKIDQDKVQWLEQQIAKMEEVVPQTREFIISGDTPSEAAASVARTVVRRAERRVSDLIDHGEFENPAVLPYLNRLSSLCFLIELSEIQSTGKTVPTLAKK